LERNANRQVTRWKCGEEISRTSWISASIGRLNWCINPGDEAEAATLADSSIAKSFRTDMRWPTLFVAEHYSFAAVARLVFESTFFRKPANISRSCVLSDEEL